LMGIDDGDFMMNQGTFRVYLKRIDTSKLN
jgi:hypothetical protein